MCNEGVDHEKQTKGLAEVKKPHQSLAEVKNHRHTSLIELTDSEIAV